MAFDPRDYIIHLPRKVKDPQTGQWKTVHDDYLEVKFRLVMFREKYPHGRITTEEIAVDLDRGYARFKATVEDGEGGLATGYGTETKAGFADYCERAETRALGRALAVLGFGTQFVSDELSEGEHVADAPVASPTGNGRASEPVSSNGHAPEPGPDASLEHLTESHLAALKNLACTECGDPIEVYEDRLRTTMKIPKNASVSPRLLVRSMSMTTYMDIFAYYRRLEAQLAKGKEIPGANDSTPPPTSQPAPAPTGENPPAVPSPATPSSSAASDPADAAERDRIVQEAMDAGIPEQEARHIVTHHSLKSAHALLVAAAKKRLHTAA